MQSSKEKLLIILGSTAVGKSDLALQLSKHINIEIINADTMQCFRSLDISTNKPTLEEQKQVPHHLFGIVDPTEEFSVIDFQKCARKLISEINQRGKLPVLVGGTNYYVQSVIFEDFLIEKGKNDDSMNQSNSSELQSENLYEELKKVDPEIAAKLHPNAIRKIKRYLEIYKTHNIKPSELLKKQKKTLRYDCFVIWLGCAKDVLNERIDKRAHKMIEKGMLKEFQTFKKEWMPKLKEIYKEQVFEQGILQSIGYKEFNQYLEALEQGKKQQELDEILKSAILKLQTVTKNYARKQISWLKNTWAVHDSPLLNHSGKYKSILFELDTSDLSKWESEVLGSAVAIAKGSYPTHSLTVNKALVSGEEIPKKILDTYQVKEPKAHKVKEWKKYKCEICNGKVVNGEQEWKAHLQSRMHKRRLSKRNKSIRDAMKTTNKT